MKMLPKLALSTFTAALAFCSLPAVAETEVGVFGGYDFMSASQGGSSQGGLMAGARAGYRTASGLVIDAQFIRHSSSSGGLTTAQMLAGVGARYHFFDTDLSPFASAHINHHLAAHIEGGGESMALGNSSGLGMDVGGGVQLGINGTWFIDVTSHYAIQFMGDLRYNSLGMGLGAGTWF